LDYPAAPGTLAVVQDRQRDNRGENPYAPPAADDPGTAGAVRDPAVCRARLVGLCSLCLGALLLLTMFWQLPIWVDHLENASMLREGSPEALRREVALAWAGIAATLLQLAVGVALIVVGLGQRRRRPWSRRMTLATGALALLLGGGVGVTLHQLGQSPPSSWLFLFVPVVFAGAMELILGSRQQPG
jgi:hypothetical protein